MIRLARTTSRVGCLLFLLGAGLPVSPTLAQPSDPPPEVSSAKAMSRAFQYVARKIEPSVVHITQLNRVQMVQRDWFGLPIRTGESRLTQTGLGSGFIVSADGYILTNNHVVQGAEALVVRRTDQTEFPATVVGRDEATDLAVVKIDASGLTPVQFTDSDAVEVGEWVLAAGSPFGFSNTVTAGIVSAKGRSGIVGLQQFQDFIQTDAVINPGNSGGPLVNLEGKVVGVNSAIASRTGGSEGIAFTIPSNIARSVMDQIIKTGRVARGYLGVSLPEARPGTPEGLQTGEGVPLVSVSKKSPAEKAGLRDGDVVLSYQGRAFQGPLTERITRLRTAIATTAPRTEVKMEVLRDGQRRSLVATTGDQTESMAVELGGIVISELGAAARTLSTQDLRDRGINAPGAAEIVNLDGGGRADRATIKVGDIIVGFDGDEVKSAEHLAKLAARAGHGRPSRAMIIRLNRFGGGEQGYLDIPD